MANFDSCLFDPVFFLRWSGKPQLEDVTLLRQRLQEAREAAGPNLVYVAVIPVGLTPPDSEVRDQLNEGMLEARQLCSSIHLVVEGSGPGRTLMRAVLGGILLNSVQGLLGRSNAAAQIRGPVSVHATVQEALTQAQTKVSFEMDSILHKARNQGFTHE